MPTAQAKSAAAFLPAVDVYINRAQPFAQPVLEHLRELTHKAVPGIEEAMKWSMPFFIYKGIILAHLAGFKQHCSFGIWNENVNPLMKEGVEARGGGMGSLGKLKSMDDLPPDKDLKALLKVAAARIDSGERTKNWAARAKKDRATPEVPEAFAAALKKNKPAAKVFEGMSASCRREYCEWIGEAKREATRDARIATALEWIAEGKQRNWKYQNC